MSCKEHPVESTRKNPAPTVAGLPVEAPVHAPEELVTFSVKIRRVTGSQNANLVQTEPLAGNGNGTYAGREE